MESSKMSSNWPVSYSRGPSTLGAATIVTPGQHAAEKLFEQKEPRFPRFSSGQQKTTYPMYNSKGLTVSGSGMPKNAYSAHGVRPKLYDHQGKLPNQDLKYINYPRVIATPSEWDKYLKSGNEDELPGFAHELNWESDFGCYWCAPRGGKTQIVSEAGNQLTCIFCLGFQRPAIPPSELYK
jgi:hypothetical protein